MSPADIQRIEDAAAALRRTPEIRNVVRSAGASNIDYLHATRDAVEAVIERGLASFVEVGLALAAMRDRELYKETHATFEAYCKERWGLSRSYAYETIDATVRVSAVADIDPTAPLPLNPKQATALGPVADDPQAMADVMHEVGDKPTVAKITEVVRRTTTVDLETGEIAPEQETAAPAPEHLPDDAVQQHSSAAAGEAAAEADPEAAEGTPPASGQPDKSKRLADLIDPEDKERDRNSAARERIYKLWLPGSVDEVPQEEWSEWDTAFDHLDKAVQLWRKNRRSMIGATKRKAR